ncbi:MAG TPA: prepilin-type N-terminal cleavage/methylation domain-containing protein [Vicinamibacterales bacterium]
MAALRSRNGATRSAGEAQSGFTLIEILVAFTVAALLLGALYQIFSTGLRSASATEDYSNAILLAESALEVFGVEEALVPGESRDRIDQKYQRRVVVRPRPDLLSRSIARPAVTPYEVEVDITWQNGRQARSVSLATVRLGSPP